MSTVTEREALVGACLFGQSGGPTAVINASAAGVFTEALRSTGRITHVYGAAYGIDGVFQERFYDMAQESPEELHNLCYTPSSALGSVRRKIKSEKDLQRILEVFQKYNIRFFFYNGGNDSMDTCNKVSKYLLKHHYACNVIGIPKTVDNDLVGTDHCPGYGSAAKFVATNIMSMYLDATVYQKGQVTIVEVMGRDAGWLTASAALAARAGCGPDLLYLPEGSFSREKFIEQVKQVLKENRSGTGSCFIAASEGIRTADGKLVASQPALAHDTFGHARLGGLCRVLESYVNDALPSVKTRSVELNILQRCAAYLASEVDVKNAFEAGRHAVRSALEGHTDRMVSFQRSSASGGGLGARFTCTLVPIDASANSVKHVPDSWILPDNRGMSEAFFTYAMPLVQGESKAPFSDGLPRFARLRKILARAPGSAPHVRSSL